MKVKKKHLTGQIADFPLHIVQLMVDEQVRQGCKANPSVFANKVRANILAGGFRWTRSVLGYDCWYDVIVNGLFHRIPEPEKAKGCTHAKVMRQYAKDAKTSKTPWDKWEFCCVGEDSWYPLGTHPLWMETTQYRRKSDNQAEPVVEGEEQPTPNEIVRAMLDKDIPVWGCASDESYEDARGKLGYFAYRIIGYDDDAEYPMLTKSLSWTYVVPIDITTMTEITEMPK